MSVHDGNDLKYFVIGNRTRVTGLLKCNIAWKYIFSYTANIELVLWKIIKEAVGI